jgi:formylglycine-generating enzyme required for sulfatase activity
MRFGYIPAGEFLMGTPPGKTDPSERQHRVRISKPFLLGITHVTVHDFRTFVDDSGYQTTAEREGFSNGAWNAAEHRWIKLAGASWRRPGFEQREDHPVVSVSWDDAVAFCAWLSKREGRHYHLPSEAQWEYACRAGTQSVYPWGDNPDDGHGWANGCDQVAKQTFNLFPPFNWTDGYLYTSPVATFKRNALGLYDMIGNALQWCDDWYGEYPANDSVTTDPTGPATGTQRVLRGGAFVYGPGQCRCAFRGRNDPDFRNFYIGFRVMLDIFREH